MSLLLPWCSTFVPPWWSACVPPGGDACIPPGWTTWWVGSPGSSTLVLPRLRPLSRGCRGRRTAGPGRGKQQRSPLSPPCGTGRRHLGSQPAGRAHPLLLKADEAFVIVVISGGGGALQLVRRLADQRAELGVGLPRLQRVDEAPQGGRPGGRGRRLLLLQAIALLLGKVDKDLEERRAAAERGRGGLVLDLDLDSHCPAWSG